MRVTVENCFAEGGWYPSNFTSSLYRGKLYSVCNVVWWKPHHSTSVFVFFTPQREEQTDRQTDSYYCA